MGQRSATSSSATSIPLRVSVFATPLGYWGLVGQEDVLFRLTLGHRSASAAQEALGDSCDGRSVEPRVSDWNVPLRQRLERYSAGERVKFDDIKLYLPQMTAFQQQIIKLTRKIPHGTTLTYGELAARAKHPRAARAVGTVMSTNRIPVIIPCHRVVGAGGNPGGYSAPQGLSLKMRLLELEKMH